MSEETNKGRKLAGRIERYVGYTTGIAETCSLISRHAQTYDRIQELWCNEEMSDRRRELLERKEAQLEARIRTLVGELPGWDDENQRGEWRVRFGGDPRGATVVLVMLNHDREISCHV